MKTEMVRLLKKAVKRNQLFVDTCCDDLNPQVVKMVNENKGEILAYNNILTALLTKSLASLRIAAGE
jgi:hypothetical protein